MCSTDWPLVILTWMSTKFIAIIVIDIKGIVDIFDRPCTANPA